MDKTLEIEPNGRVGEYFAESVSRLHFVIQGMTERLRDLSIVNISDRRKGGVQLRKYYTRNFVKHLNVGRQFFFGHDRYSSQ